MPQASGWEEGNWGLDIQCLRTVTGALCSADPQQDLVLENTSLHNIWPLVLELPASRPFKAPSVLHCLLEPCLT